MDDFKNIEDIEVMEDFPPLTSLETSNPIDEAIDMSEYIEKKHFYLVVTDNLRVALTTVENGSDEHIFEITEEEFNFVQGKIIEGYVGRIGENFIELLQNYKNIEDIIIFDDGVTIIPLPKTPEQLQLEALIQENADLLLDSAIKDTKIENLQSDIADIMKEMAKGGQI